jgi:hypothetical protein
MLRVDGIQRERADLDVFAGFDLHHIVVRPAQQLAEAARDDDPRPAAQSPKRRQVQVIVVRVRNQDDVDVDVLEKMRHGIGVPMERSEPVDKQWVGEDAHAIQLQQNGRVPEVPQQRAHGASVVRRY